MADPDSTTPFDGGEARRLIRGASLATLATLLDDGAPYASLVKVASDDAGRPIIHVSRLAWHTRNLEADGRASLLFSAAGGPGDPLQASRVTALGRMTPCAQAACAQRFLASHPDAAGYAKFGDFSFWRMDVERCHAVAGFGRIDTFEADAVVLPSALAQAIEQLAPDALEHMNEAHAETLGLYATRLLGQPGGDWRATALDPDGITLSNGKRTVRLNFPQVVSSAGELRASLKALADKARIV